MISKVLSGAIIAGLLMAVSAPVRRQRCRRPEDEGCLQESRWHEVGQEDESLRQEVSLSNHIEFY